MFRRRQQHDDPAWEEPRAPSLGDDYSGTRALRRLYIMLGLTIVVATAIVLAFPHIPVVDWFGANIATEAAAILVTLVFVHRFLQQQDRERRLRASIGALRRASRGVVRLTDVWLTLLKGTLPKATMERPRALPALFRPVVTEGLIALDPQARRRDDAGPDETWARWARDELDAALGVLHDIIVAYGASLDPAYVEAVDDLIDDAFVRTFTELVETKADARAWRVRLNAARTQREVHFARLARLLELHNELARQAGKVRAAWGAPRSGVLGFNLDPDADLRIDIRVDADKWEAAPPAGSLRAETARSGL
jgi:hypothetical protein